jgi:hypothetical protein
MAVKTHSHQLTKTDNAIHHIASGGSKKTEAKASAVKTKMAAKSIPLDDNHNNDELKEFNS